MKLSVSCSVAAAMVAGSAFFFGCSPTTDGSEIDLTAQAKAAAVASGYEPSANGDGAVLHIYTWCDYFSPDVIRSFEQALGVKIEIDTFDSNEAMYAKLKAGATGYDIITPSSYQIATMAKEGMIRKLDHSKIPNVKANFDRSFEKQIIDPTFTYNVPYAVTYTGLMYSKDRIPEGVDVNSWSILSNAAMRGRITLLDDIREVIGAGLMFRGYSVNSTNPAEIDAAVEQVLAWRANIRKFDAESYKTEVPGGSTWIGHGYSTDSTQVIVGDEASGLAPRDDIGFALPKEGFSIAFDEMVVSKHSKNLNLAYAFINYIYDGDVAAVNMEYICGPNPVAPGIAKLDEEYRHQIILSDDVIARGQVLLGFDDSSDAMALYNRAWDRIKATDRQNSK